MAYKAQQIREKMARGEVVIGGHTFYTDPAITEALGMHGFEFVWIDGEHSAFDRASLLQHIMAAGSAGTASLVRVAWNDPALIKPILEMGPDGIVIPMVSSKEEAQRAMEACLYPPKGIRGFGPKRSIRYGAMDTETYLKEAEESFLRIVQIEHVDAVKSLPDILEVEGVDLPLVGANDLSASVGLLGNTKHPEVRALCREVVDVCRSKGRPFGVSLGADDREAIHWWIEQGVSFIGCGDDVSFISSGSKAALAYARECVNTVS